MAVDKKSQHVGNHGGRYVDQDGLSRQFTYIDHDKKTKISTDKMTKKERQANKEAYNQYIENSIAEILIMPAISYRNSFGLYEEFVIRHPDKGVIWDEEMVRNACRINNDLRYNLWITVWRNTVREQYWFHDLTHEEMMEEKWRAWV